MNGVKNNVEALIKTFASMAAQISKLVKRGVRKAKLFVLSVYASAWIRFYSRRITKEAKRLNDVYRDKTNDKRP